MKIFWVLLLIILNTYFSFSWSENLSKEAYISKMARVLRPTSPPPDATEIKSLSQLDDSQIADYFLNGDQFPFVVLDFNLYFLKSSRGNLFDIGTERINDAAFQHHNATLSAQEFEKNGNYLSLLDVEVPVFMGQTREPKTYQRVFPGLQGDELTQIMHQRYLNRFVNFRNGLINVTDPFAACNMPTFDGGPLVSAFAVMRSSGSLHTFGDLLNVEFDTNYYLNCVIKSASPLRFDANLFDKIRPKIEQMNKDLNLYFVKNYPIKKVSDIKLAPDYLVPEKKEFRRLTFSGFWQANTNSSTNYNRKRAANILSTYFCDDLTPIGFVAPDTHTNNKHASDKGCMACHYKLDPMAGFFKNYGIRGYDFSNSEKLIFEDGVEVKNSEYEKNWFSESPNRKFEIGYIRSTNDQSKNSYGENLTDLLQIIKTAPEVKACLVKKMSEYFLSRNTSLDAGYLDFLTQDFINQSKQNSSIAFKKLVKKLVTSNSFKQKDPLTGTCYDYRPGDNPFGRPPCEINFIIQTNCTKCHKSTNHDSGLDLTKWMLINGKYSFPHLDDDGKQKSKEQTFNAIKFRVETEDHNLQMPPQNSQFMSAKDREKLYLWTQKVLSGEE